MFGQFLQLFLAGVAQGCVYALVALGFVLIYKATETVNFAQGDLVMIGGYLLAMFAPQFGPWLAFGLVIVAMAAFSLVFRRLTYDPIAEQSVRDFTPFVVTTIGASIFLRDLARLVWGAQPALPESPFGQGSTEIAGVFVPYHEAGIVAITIAVLALLYFVFQKTMLGVRLRAVVSSWSLAVPKRLGVAAFPTHRPIEKRRGPRRAGSLRRSSSRAQIRVAARSSWSGAPTSC